jgi:hypothetical protein
MAKLRKSYRKDVDENALVSLALLHSGEIQKDPELYAKAVEFLEQRPLRQSYDAALTLMGLAHVDPQRHRPRIRKLAQSLIDGQSKHGPWSYIGSYVSKVEPEAAPAATDEPPKEDEGGIDVVGGDPIPGWPGTEERAEEVTLKPTQAVSATGGDNSCSQYGVLGLQTSGRVGVKATAETWERAAGWFLDAQNPRRGWGYGKRATNTGSMTTAGLAGLAVARHNLDGKPEKSELALREGVDWLARNFALDRNPGSGSWHYYYLYGLERAGRLLGKEFFGPYEWYAEGARYLVDNQLPDGSWMGIGGHKSDVLDTSFALLFLTKATEKLGEERKEVPTGPGELTLEASGLGGSVVFILDASGSMAANLGSETRFDAARRVVHEVLSGSGAGLDVALRVYGHRHRANRPEANTDSELVMGFGPADRPELKSALDRLRCRGKTPLTFSLLESLKDLQKAANKKRRVILLTDGMESDRRAKPMDAAAAVKAAGARLDVVCLCMDSTELLERMAAAGGGTCYSANDAQELLDAFTVAVVGGVPFRVKTPEGKVVFEGKSGETAKLPAGPYVVEVDLPGKPQTVEAWVHQDRTTTLRVRAGG